MVPPRPALDVPRSTDDGAADHVGRTVGVGVGAYVGVWACEYQSVLNTSPAGQSVYAATAATCSVVCGRLSFVFALQGPCVSFDTACSSGLVANHAGVRALQQRECDTALVAGVNMLFSPEVSFTTGVAGMTSPRGRSRTRRRRPATRWW